MFLSLSHVVSWVRCGTRLYRFLVLATCTYFVTCYYGLGLKPPFEPNIFVLHQQQNLERIFDTSKMHLSPPPPLAKAAVLSKGVVLMLMISTCIVVSCYCSMFLSITLFIYLLHLLTSLTYLLTYSLTGDRRHA